jgi:hypothetical protein
VLRWRVLRWCMRWLQDDHRDPNGGSCSMTEHKECLAVTGVFVSQCQEEVVAAATECDITAPTTSQPYVLVHLCMSAPCLVVGFSAEPRRRVAFRQRFPTHKSSSNWLPPFQSQNATLKQESSIRIEKETNHTQTIKNTNHKSQITNH